MANKTQTGFTLTTEKVPPRHERAGGTWAGRVSVYDTIIKSFVQGRAKNVRVEVDGKNYKNVYQGLHHIVKRDKLDVKVQTRKIGGDVRIYLSK